MGFCQYVILAFIIENGYMKLSSIFIMCSLIAKKTQTLNSTL